MSSIENVWGTVDLLAGHNSRRGKDTFDDIHEWLNSIVRKTQKCYENRLQKNENNQQQQQQQQQLLSNDETTGFGGSETLNSTSPDGLTVKQSSKKNRSVQQQNKSRLENNQKMNNPNHQRDGRKTKKKKVKVDVGGTGGAGGTGKNKGKRIDKNALLKPQEDEEYYGTDYFGPLVDVSFNLPRVSAQLEKLMGTNVVRLTDRQYMQELRTRIQEDYNTTLQRRIHQRETREMERERNLMMTGKVEKCPDELTENPVFSVNQQTNNQLAKTRSKLKTKREKNAERLIRQGAKWEREREYNDEMDRIHEIEMKQDRENALLMGNTYPGTGAGDFLRIKNRDYTANEVALKNFMDMENQKMLSRFRSRSNHTSKDVNEEFEADGIETALLRGDYNKTPTSQQTVDDDGLSQKTFKMTKTEPDVFVHPPSGEEITETNCDDPSFVDLSKDDNENVDESITTLDMERDSVPDIGEGHVLSKKDYDKLHYEDPKITQLKQANNALELYALADEIIGGIAVPTNTKFAQI